MKGQKYILVALGVLVLALVGLVARQGGVGSAVAQPSAAALGATDGGLGISVAVSRPANGSFFVAGERAVVTVTLKDKLGVALNKGDFATLNLYAYGPQETAKTVTASKLLNAVTDRSKTPHHYINLLTDTNVVLECCTTGQTRPSGLEGNVLKYTFQPVSNEEPGTYTASLYYVKKGDPPVNQAFVLTDFQLGTATVEKQIVEKEKCAACHLGASSGQFYFAHVDPGRSPYGSPAIDNGPVRNCKSCHNNDGYAAYRGDANNPSAATTVRTPDPIVRRVHGVHMGEELKNPFNTNPTTGDFRDYMGVVFPADARNCTACHVDDRYKTQVSRQACGTCHDAAWFGDAAATPAKFVNHPGGPQANDAACTACHTPSSGPLSIAVLHDPAVNVDHDVAVLTLSAPANGKFFVAGEKPVVTIVYKDATGNPIDHTKVDALLNAANFYVYGPREQSKPVLTTAAKLGRSKSLASANSSIAASGAPKGWTFAAGDTFKIAVNGGAAQVLTAPAGLQTPADVVAWLNSQLTGITASVNGDNVTIRSKVEGENSRLEFYNSPITTKMGWKPGGLDIIEHGKVVGKTVGTTVEPFVVIGAPSTVANSLLGTADPAVTRSADKITYQLDDVAGLTPGTYMVYTYTTIKGVTTKKYGLARSAFGTTEFQVGTATLERKVASNCSTCHAETIMHLNAGAVHPARFDPDSCKACHDYQRFGTGESFSRVGGTSTLGWSGYGAKPIAARIHGVHFGRYLNHKEDVYGGNPNVASEIIFPQDVRNCSVCHPSTGSSSWKENPSRLACTACHDSDKARSHTKLQTEIVAGDPYSQSNTETCAICHGVGKDFAVEKVHNISNPYKPPYPREPE